MSDLTPDAAPVGAPTPPAAEANGQLIVSFSIVVVLGLIGGGLIIAGIITSKWDVLAGGIGAIIGALATALNAPTGIGAVLRANKAADQ